MSRRPRLEQRGQWVHYTCTRCNGVTVAKHEHDGRTPPSIWCRKPSTTKLAGECEGLALSDLYLGSQDNTQVPEIVFFRPASRAEALAHIDTEPLASRGAWIKHYDNGGCLMREAKEQQ